MPGCDHVPHDCLLLPVSDATVAREGFIACLVVSHGCLLIPMSDRRCRRSWKVPFNLDFRCQHGFLLSDCGLLSGFVTVMSNHFSCLNFPILPQRYLAVRDFEFGQARTCEADHLELSQCQASFRAWTSPMIVFSFLCPANAADACGRCALQPGQFKQAKIGIFEFSTVSVFISCLAAIAFSMIAFSFLCRTLQTHVVVRPSTFNLDFRCQRGLLLFDCGLFYGFTTVVNDQ